MTYIDPGNWLIHTYLNKFLWLVSYDQGLLQEGGQLGGQAEKELQNGEVAREQMSENNVLWKRACKIDCCPALPKTKFSARPCL